MRLSSNVANDDDTPGTDRIRAHVERRLGFALSRFEDRLTSVIVRLSDENGPKGGLDKRCRIELRGPDVGTFVVEERDIEWARVIDQAAAIAGRALVRAIERARSSAPNRTWRLWRAELAR